MAGRPEVLPQLTQELVQLRVDLLVATARPSIEAARAATTDLIVANDLESDPVASGYVASLARPGGNLTGFFLDAPSLCSKWLQQIGDIVPNVKKKLPFCGMYDGNVSARCNQCGGEGHMNRSSRHAISRGT